MPGLFERQAELRVTDTAALHAATQPTRRALLEHLQREDRTSRDLAAALGISQQLAYHHLTVLIGVGLVGVMRIEKTGNKDVHLYGLTAQHIAFDMPPISAVKPALNRSPEAPATP